MSSKRIVFIIINLCCPIILSTSLLIFGDSVFSKITMFIVCFVSIVCTLLSIHLMIVNKIFISKLLLIINAILSLFVFSYSILKYFDMLNVFSSVANFKLFILSAGKMGIFIYILVQLLQVVFLPIPASVIALAGAIIYGPFWGSVFCSIGVLAGSFTSYFLGKIFGFRLVSWIVGRDKTIKYSSVINNKGMMFLPIAFLLPMFPDDILCWIAGITTTSFGYYSAVTLLTRPIGVICMCYFGGGYIIPFSGWGLYVWAVLLILIILVVVFTYKYQHRMEEWIMSKLKNKEKR